MPSNHTKSDVLLVDTSLNTGVESNTNNKQSPSLEQLEYTHMGLLEGTLREMMSPAESRQYSMMAKQGRNTMKSPSESSTMGETERSNLRELREELEKADSVYSRKTEGESDSPSIVEGSFQPISPHVFRKDGALTILPIVVEPSPIKHGLPSKPVTSKDENGESATEASSNNEIPHEVFVVSPSEQQEDEDQQTQVTGTSSYAPHPTTPAKHSATTSSNNSSASENRTPPDARGWASVTEVRPPRDTTTPNFLRRHSSNIDLGRSPASFRRSAQSPVPNLLQKQEEKRQHLVNSIRAVKSRHVSLDQTLQHTLAERDQLSKDFGYERQAHQELLGAMENKIKFLQKQHAHHEEQQLGVLKLTQTHNSFLKEQLQTLQKDYVKIQLNHKEELHKVLEKPKALYQQIASLEESKEQLQANHEAEVLAQQRTYESLEAQLKHVQQEKSLLQGKYQRQLHDERSKAKMLEQQLELESRQLIIAQEHVEDLKSQRLESKQERAELVAQHQSKLLQEQGKYMSLEKQHYHVVEERIQETSSLKKQLLDLQSQLDLDRSREQQGHFVASQQAQEFLSERELLQTSNGKLELSLQSIMEEREVLLMKQQEQADLQRAMQESFLQKVAVLERECSRLQKTLETEIDRQGTQISTLATQLKQSKSHQQAQHEENQALRDELDAMKQAQEKLLGEHKQELQLTKDANANIFRNLAKDLGFGL